MGYTSKYTGEEVDNLLGQVESGSVGSGSKPKALLEKKISSISKNAAFDIDIVLNRGFEVSANNRIILKAGKTYLIQCSIHSFEASATTGQFGFAVTVNPTGSMSKWAALYSSSISNKYSNSGFSAIPYQPQTDTEITFISDEWTSNVSNAFVSCIIEEF